MRRDSDVHPIQGNSAVQEFEQQNNGKLLFNVIWDENADLARELPALS